MDFWSNIILWTFYELVFYFLMFDNETFSLLITVTHYRANIFISKYIVVISWEYKSTHASFHINFHQSQNLFSGSIISWSRLWTYISKMISMTPWQILNLLLSSSDSKNYFCIVRGIGIIFQLTKTTLLHLYVILTLVGALA